MGVYDDQEQTSKVEAIRKKRADRQKSDLAKVLGTPEGRRVIFRIISEAQPFNTPYAGPGCDSLTFINVGKKEFALTLYAEVEAQYPDLLTKMRHEAANDKMLQETELKEKLDGE